MFQHFNLDSLDLTTKLKYHIPISMLRLANQYYLNLLNIFFCYNTKINK